MDAFLAFAEEDVRAYTRENEKYRTCIEGAIGILRDALNEEARLEERGPHLGFGVVAVLHVTERNRDALRHDNERLRDVMGQVAQDLQELAARKNGDAIRDLREAEGRAGERDWKRV